MIFLLILLFTVVNSQITVNIQNDGYLPTASKVGTNTFPSLTSNAFTSKFIEVAHLNKDVTQIDTYLQVIETGELILPKLELKRFRDELYNIYYLNANSSLSYRLYVNSKPGVGEVQVIIGSSKTTFDLSTENSTYKEGNVELWWFIAAFLGGNVIFFLIAIPVFILLFIIILKRKGNPALKNEISKRKRTYGTLICCFYLCTIIPYGITVASPWIWRLPYAYTCCNYFAREGGSRCTSTNPAGLGLVAPEYSCFYGQFTKYTYMEHTWYMILASYIIGFCCFFPCFVSFLYSILQCVRLYKDVPSFGETTTIDVKPI